MSAAPEPACPFCESAEVERIAQWGGQMITSQWRCGACGSYFEALRDEFEDGAAEDPPACCATVGVARRWAIGHGASGWHSHPAVQRH